MTTVVAPARPQPAVSLRSNFTWVFSGNVVHAACGWGGLIALAKLGNPEMVGLYSLGVAICLPVAMLASLNLRAVLATDVRVQHGFGVYLGLRLLLTSLVPAAVFAICLTVGYNRQTTAAVMVLCAAQVCDSISDIYYGLLQRAEMMARIAASMIMKAILSLAALAVLIYVTHEVVWGLIGYSAGRALVTAAYDVRSARCVPDLEASYRPAWDLRTQWDLMRLALPLGVVLMLVHLSGNVPRYFIEHHLGARELGIYAALFSIFNVGNTLTTALGQAAVPRLARYFAAGERREFSVLLLQLMGIGALLGVSGIAAIGLYGKQIVTILYRPEYAAYPAELLGIMIMACISYMGQFTGIGLTAARYFKSQIPWNAAVVSACGLACYFLIPVYGLRGAVLAMIASMTVHFLIGGTLMLAAIRRCGARI